MLVKHALQVNNGHAPQQADALAQGGLEIEFTAHGPLGEHGDLGLDAFQIRHLVQAFLANYGGIHIGDEHLFAPPLGRLQAPIDGAGTGRRSSQPFQMMDRIAVKFAADKVEGLAIRKPAELKAPAQVALQIRREIEKQLF